MKDNTQAPTAPPKQEHPIDAQVRKLIEGCSNNPHGWTMSLAHETEGAEKGLRVLVGPAPTVHDPWEPPLPYRQPTIEDVPSLIAYAKKYGSADKSIIFFDGTRVTLTLDDVKANGLREVATLSFRYAREWDLWLAIMREPVAHKALLRHLITLSHTLDDVGILDSMRTVRSRATVKMDSDIRDFGQDVGVTLTVDGGDEITKFPKSFIVNVPVLADDADLQTAWARIRIRLEPVMPERSNDPVTFLLVCPDIELARRNRISHEVELLRSELASWTIVRGSHKEVERPIEDSPPRRYDTC